MGSNGQNPLIQPETLAAAADTNAALDRPLTRHPAGQAAPASRGNPVEQPVVGEHTVVEGCGGSGVSEDRPQRGQPDGDVVNVAIRPVSGGAAVPQVVQLLSCSYRSSNGERFIQHGGEWVTVGQPSSGR